MKTIFYRISMIIILVTLFVSGCHPGNRSSGAKIKVLVVAGGHSFDTTDFYKVFEQYDFIDFDTVMQPRANRMITEGTTAPYDVIVFYDMWKGADSKVREGYRKLTESGKGLVFLHHSLASYPEWQGFQDIIGGRYITERAGLDPREYSTYRHGIMIPVKVADRRHEVTRGVDDFTILDEGYGNIRVNRDVHVLLTADHPDCSDTIAWVNHYGNSTIVYLMSGHDRNAYENKNFRTLLANSIQFVSGKSH